MDNYLCRFILLIILFLLNHDYSYTFSAFICCDTGKQFIELNVNVNVFWCCLWIMNTNRHRFKFNALIRTAWRSYVCLVMWISWIWAPSKATRCFLDQETLPLFLSTGWFQERIRAWYHNETKINWGPYDRLP